jgi:hypothetical protein
MVLGGEQGAIGREQGARREFNILVRYLLCLLRL